MTNERSRKSSHDGGTHLITTGLQDAHKDYLGMIKANWLVRILLSAVKTYKAEWRPNLEKPYRRSGQPIKQTVTRDIAQGRQNKNYPMG
jgi:hypothetical protein